jgi:hypothetical protein
MLKRSLATLVETRARTICGLSHDGGLASRVHRADDASIRHHEGDKGRVHQLSVFDRTRLPAAEAAFHLALAAPFAMMVRSYSVNALP